MSVAAVILAAGASHRLGELKQLVRLGRETLLERAVRLAIEAACDPVVVVLGASAENVRKQVSLNGVTFVVNDSWAEGMGSSVRAGVRVLSATINGCIIMTCDMPAVTAGHLQELMKTGRVTASAYGGRHGVPAYFPQEMFVQLLKLQGDTGARELLKEAEARELAGGEMDIDTAEDLARARQLLEKKD